MSDENSNESERFSGQRRYVARPKICQFCADKNIAIDYKNTDLLRRFVTEDGKIRPRRQTGTCARHQRSLATAIKRARHIALLPFTGERWSEVIR
jgi:small subunit ribosomal protein S18